MGNRECLVSQLHWYIPFGLTFRFRDKTHIATGIEVSPLGLLLCKSNYPGRGGYLSGCTPLLVPMEEVTKPMVVKGYNDGEEFIPLIEMAKLIYPEDGKYPISEYSLDDETVTCHYYSGSYDKMTFLEYSLNMDSLTIPEVELLCRWHFDFQGLIPKFAEDTRKYL